MTILKSLKQHLASVSEHVRKKIVEFTDSTYIRYCPENDLKSSKHLKIIFPFISVLNAHRLNNVCVS